MTCKSVSPARGFVKRGSRLPLGPGPRDHPWYDARMPSRFTSVLLGPNDDGRRLDRVVRKALPHLPLSRIYSAIRSGEIRVNGRKSAGNCRVSAGDALEVRESLAGPAFLRPAAPVPGKESADAAGIESRIVYQSDDILVINKLRGELVHRGTRKVGRGESGTKRRSAGDAGQEDQPTLTECVERYLAGRTAEGVSFRPGPLHRLDRNTSGLMMFSASLQGARDVSAALRAGSVRKLYVAVLAGVASRRERWQGSVARDEASRVSRVADTGGKPAASIVSPVKSIPEATLAVIEILTGRTHQIRVQAADNGAPLLGDRKYGAPPRPGGYILHAGALELHPDLGRLWAPLPPASENYVRETFGEPSLRELYRTLAGDELPTE